MSRYSNIPDAAATDWIQQQRNAWQQRIGSVGYFEWWDDFLRGGANWTQVNVGTGGGPDAYRVDPGGTAQVHSGATAASSAAPYAALYNPFNLGGTTKRWMIAARFGLITTPDANAKIFVGGVDVPSVGIFANYKLAMGAIGSVSTTAYVAQIVGAGTSNLASSVAIDLNVQHTHQLWMDGALVYYSVDGATPATVATTNLPAAPSVVSMGAGNGATAADQGMRLDAVYYASERLA